MQIEDNIEPLYNKDGTETYNKLLELEEVSDKSNVLYKHFDEFLEMLASDKYGIRVRGFCMLCKQAKWDVDNKINKNIDKILKLLEDEKPTAVRQYLQSMKDVVKYKKELNLKVKEKLLSINCMKYKDTMQNLILKDIEELMLVMK